MSGTPASTIGLAGAYGVGRLLQSLMFQIPPYDPLTRAGIAVVVIVVATTASFLPARKATGVDPLAALRYD